MTETAPTTTTDPQARSLPDIIESALVVPWRAAPSGLSEHRFLEEGGVGDGPVCGITKPGGLPH